MEIAKIKIFLEDLLKIAGFLNFEISVQENSQDKIIQLSIKTNSQVDDSGLLIGRDGENLQAFEYLLNIFSRRRFQEYDFRVFLDINNYRAMQEEKLREFARKAARQVALTKKTIELPPMKARDRRIIHLEIALRSDVSTESVGERKERHIIIKPQEK
jgi:spoIIIJ-associated protein